MKITVIGTGYVGLVTATCLAESGNEVIGLDTDARKIDTLESGRLPIYEPGLLELVQRNHREGRLVFTTDYAKAIPSARLIFLAVGTPSTLDGQADLTYIFKATEQVAAQIGKRPVPPFSKILVIKSTVPVGTNQAVAALLAKTGCQGVEVASNPEFLKEGAALDDFQKPDRVVVGVRRAEVGEVLRELYAGFLRTEHPFLVMSPESAEMTKYAANAMLATKISYINEMANLCDQVGADINDVRRGIGHDARIGFQFLFPGAGYGGSCFPKDIRAIINTGKKVSVPMRLMESVDAVNEAQKKILSSKIRRHFRTKLAGRTLAIWGLSFKPRTDDIREAPALALIDDMLAEGVHLRVHDPEAMKNVREVYREKLIYCDRPYGALEGADALAIVTEWQEFRHPDFEVIKRLLKFPVIFDGRNLYEPRQMETLGFTYYAIGQGQRE
ncbi:MAG TPA: UDP-glucose/GDP-mannose dehydrogenase family protein [Gemmataceae bacterium]|jgi:UDPglucose 6-dehydrogenase|nr:UDP-glucose/GDP-mannose dehydrogenase family protein [Gemmataceae bacterium]